MKRIFLWHVGLWTAKNGRRAAYEMRAKLVSNILGRVDSAEDVVVEQEHRCLLAGLTRTFAMRRHEVDICASPLQDETVQQDTRSHQTSHSKSTENKTLIFYKPQPTLQISQVGPIQ
jgi:hypothetical protein